MNWKNVFLQNELRSRQVEVIRLRAELAVSRKWAKRWKAKARRDRAAWLTDRVKADIQEVARDFMKSRAKWPMRFP